MYSTTTAFQSAILNSHKIATRVDLLTGGVVTTTLTNKATGGYITLDRAADSRRAAYITLSDETGTLVPTGGSSDTLNLYGTEFAPYRGITYPDGTTELIPLGIFVITNMEVAESGAGLYIKISGKDRSQRVRRALLTDTYVIASGTNVVNAIKGILQARMPGIQFSSVDSTPYTTPLLVYDVGSDPWKIAVDLGASIGYDVYFDANGKCNIKQYVNPYTKYTADFTYQEGDSNTMLSTQRYYKDDEHINWHVFTSEVSGSTPLRAEAKDTNANSPTYVYGPYGYVVKHTALSNVTSQAGLQSAANRALAQSLGSTDLAYIVATPNPALDIDDLLYVKRAASKVDGYYILDQVTIPLEAGAAANVGARKRF